KDPRFDEACELMRKGAQERARMLFSQLLSENPDDYVLMQDIAVVYRESGLQEECVAINQATLRNLLLKSRMEEADALALDMIQSGESAETDPQLLLKVGKHLSTAGRAGESHDVYRHIIRANVSPTVSAKASIALAKLLASKMQNFVDAINVLEEAKGLEISPVLRTTLGELQDSINEKAGQYT
ncbi:MAG TPA: hypothetical protein VLA34_14140, partial [Candidatus Krumholzibacterium sp.]|nr:hypothetical protein [Candidatus Krumholzibacterium sp.]